MFTGRYATTATALADNPGARGASLERVRGERSPSKVAAAMNDDTDPTPPKEDSDDETLRVQRALRLTQPPPPALAARLRELSGVDRLLAERWVEATPAGAHATRARRPDPVATASSPGRQPLRGPALPPRPAVSLPRDEGLRERALEEVRFAVLDLETTGLYPAVHEIIEFAVFEVHAEHARLLDASLVAPRARVPFEIAALTGIDAELLEGAPELDEALPRLAAALRERVLVAHNASFDVAFLNRALAERGHDDFGGGVLCTRRLARRLRPDLPKRSLDALAEAYGLDNRARHRATGDARVTADLLIELLRQARALGVRTLGDLEALCNAPPAKHVDYSRYAFGPARLAHLSTGPGVYRMLDSAGEVFYVGKARNLRERVGSYFRGRARGRSALVRERLYDFDIAHTHSELEALLLEAAEIRALRPALNVQVNVRRRGIWLRVSARAGQVRVVNTPAPKDPDEASVHGPFIDPAGGREAAKSLRLAFELACPPVYPRVDADAFLRAGVGADVLTRALEDALARIAGGTEATRADALRKALRTVRRVAAQHASAGDAHHRRDLLVRLPSLTEPRLFLFRDGHPLERLCLRGAPTDEELLRLTKHVRALLAAPAPPVLRTREDAEAHLLVDNWLARNGAQASLALGDVAPHADGDGPDPLQTRIRALVDAASPADVAVFT